MRVRRLFENRFDRYRPELHYMRGPGPKWREKHGVGATDNSGGTSPGRTDEVSATTKGAPDSMQTKTA
jgi:hypothetical protein